MPPLDATATSEQVVATFASQVKGRTFVITGAGEPSIGSSMAVALAKASPAHILIASRTAAKVEPVLKAVEEVDSSVKTTFVQVDLSDHESVRRAAPEILAATGPKIDVLVNSAGNMAVKDYTTDKQGIEIQLSTNHVGHFLLTNLLMPAILAAAKNNGHEARIVNLSSAGYQISPVRFNDYNYSDGKTYEKWTGYGQAKTANILFAHGLNKRLVGGGGGSGIAAHAVHPGSNVDTQLGAHLSYDDYGELVAVCKRNTGIDFDFGTPRFKSFAQIGATPLVAALDPALPPAAVFLANCQPADTYEHARDPESVEKLWRLSEKLVGQEFGY